MESATVWELKEYDIDHAREMAEELGISVLLAKLLTQRGVKSSKDAHSFLFAGLEELSDPFNLSGIQAAVKRIEQAVAMKEKVVIYGDYDVDGVCSTVLLVECLRLLGGDVDYYIPDRFSEGYGLNSEAVQNLVEKGFKLLITVDCGINSVIEVELATELEMDVIITDHHTPGERLPEAVAIINPKLDRDINSRDLAGVGVAFKLAQALCRSKIPDAKIYDWLDLVALATVADIVPLRGDNRLLVKYGLQKIQDTRRTGLRALIMKSGLEEQDLSSWHIGFMLAPRLNSAGRLNNAGISVDLLLEQDENEALKLAELLCELNNRRKTIEEAIYKEALLQVENTLDLKEENLLVLAGEEWHQGVIGIVASRLSNHYNRAAILISWEGEMGKGSARSIPALNIYQALSECSQYLASFGGHKMAAGISIQMNDYQAFRKAINDWTRGNVTAEELKKKESIDVEIEVDEINEDFLKELELLQPFGEGNPLPRFVLRSMDISSVSLVGKEKEHCKLRVVPGDLDGIAFNRPDFANLPLNDCYHDIACHLEENEFRGKKSIQLKVKDMKTSFLPDKLYPDNDVSSQRTAIINRTMQEIGNRRPVFFVYPTYRTLEKGHMLLQHFFKSSILRILHGKMPAEKRAAMEAELEKGLSRIYIVTQAFMRYYIQGRNLPANLRYIVQVWSLGMDEDWQTGLSNYEKGIFNPVKKVNLKQEDWHYDNCKRSLIYTNRPKTLRSFSNGSGNIMVEAGIPDIRKRKAIRRCFRDMKSGVLLTDGVYDGGICGSWRDVFDELLFADLPFNIYESMLLLEQIASREELAAAVLFDKNSLDFNRHYLRRVYPDLHIIKQLLSYFQRRKQEHNPISEEINKLAASVENSIGREFKAFDLLPLLQILVDLGLCQTKKRGSIIEIKFLDKSNQTMDLARSPYYLEGLYEKKAFIDLETEVNNFLLW